MLFGKLDCQKKGHYLQRGMVLDLAEVKQATSERLV